MLVRVCRWFFFFKQKTAYELRISDWSSDVCSSDLEFGDNRCHEIFKRMARDDMLAARAELSAGHIFEHFPIHGENVERDLGPGEIWHHDNLVDWTAQSLIAHRGELLLGTNAAAFGILKVITRRYIHQAPSSEERHGEKGSACKGTTTGVPCH